VHATTLPALPTRRLLLVVPAALAAATLLLGLWSGLVRLGVPMPVPGATATAAHGPLMVAGFFGTLIGLERAAALGRWWGLGAPVLSAASTGLLLAGAPGAHLGYALAALVLLVASATLAKRRVSAATVTVTAGAAALLAGDLLWAAGWPVMRLVPWWMAFLLLTVAGERLELSRLLRRSAFAERAYVAALALYAGGVVAAGWFGDAGTRAMGLGMVALAAWLTQYDLARRTIHKRGQTRFVAAALLSGYVWLAIAGATALARGAHADPFTYDALLHAFFLGFVFSMVFGHAPIIAPALLRVRVAYGPAFWAPLVLLHASLALRVAGDLTWWFAGRRAGGVLGAVAILSFAAVMVRASLRGRHAA
jgi:hypothetical protein